MTMTRIDGPSLPAITLDEAKRYLRIDGSDEDETLTSLIAGATDFLERDTGLALLTQTWRIYVDPLPDNHAVTVALRPAHVIVGVTAYDRQGAPTLVSSEHWFFNTISNPSRLRFLPGFDRSVAENGIEIDVLAGFGDTGADVPDTVKQALLALVAHWFEFRHAFSAEDQPVSVPEAYSRLMRNWRSVRL